MEDFLEFIEHINNGQQRARTQEVLEWVKSQFPNLEARIAWNQPMFTEHGTFIIGFSVSSKHLAVSPERAGMVRFTNEITKAGYSQSKMLFRIRWEEPVNYILLDQIIRFNCIDKAECKTCLLYTSPSPRD